jgi:hypothetical protein
MAKEPTKEVPVRDRANEPIGEVTPDPYLTASILDRERSWYPFVLVICGSILVIGTIPLVFYTVMQRSAVVAALALVSLVGGLVMRRKGKL